MNFSWNWAPLMKVELSNSFNMNIIEDLQFQSRFKVIINSTMGHACRPSQWHNSSLECLCAHTTGTLQKEIKAFGFWCFNFSEY